jgi:predicted RNA-binding protein with PUA-like domain
VNRRLRFVPAAVAMKSAPAHPNHWLVKSEPEAYAWADLVRDGRTAWTGVRNYQARIHLNAMRPGDQVLFYESVTTKAVLGLAEVTKPAFPDPTADEPGWVAVELKAVRALAAPVTLASIKAEPTLAQIGLIRQSRLSVVPLTKAEFGRIVALGRAGA